MINDVKNLKKKTKMCLYSARGNFRRPNSTHAESPCSISH